MSKRGNYVAIILDAAEVLLDFATIAGAVALVITAAVRAIMAPGWSALPLVVIAIMLLGVNLGMRMLSKGGRSNP